ncbi:hypothetical protein GAGA_5000 [Paraglaciecola agarilytica NO2]|uniref:Uncharacterized protein n=1 Tax=Paraglaciecola agarilytica NO2 TaxID=1125747 RepID=A0ABQ0IEJ6_9ALTE|nr:hypothetical protein GAGA_5000 [Paraglaciecola agarilytica NO2]
MAYEWLAIDYFAIHVPLSLHFNNKIKSLKTITYGLFEILG